jgi:hypothetical protein
MGAAMRRATGWALGRCARGCGAALRGRPGIFAIASALVAASSLLVPPAVLSLARSPVDYFTFNPWLSRLPEYLASEEVPLATKLDRLRGLALFWFSSDSPMGGTEWGFAVDVTDLLRILLTAVLFGLYFALWTERRARLRAAAPPALRLGPAHGRTGGMVGAVLSVSGLSTGPCSVMGCGAPVLPVIGLAVTGLSSGTLALLALVATTATVALLGALGGAVAYLGWSLGGLLALSPVPSTPPRPGAASPR